MNAAAAVQEQVLRDTLQVVDGGYIALRSGHYCVLPRHTNQHTVATGPVFEAVERGFAVVRNRTVRVTDAGWAFAGMI